MAYTNETTHYGIPLPLGSDLTTPMDYNTAMQAVDTALFGAVTDATAGVEKANAVEESLGTTNDIVSALAGRVTTAEGTIVTQGNAIIQNTQDIANVRADALDMICAVDEGTAQVASVAVSEGEYFRYNDVLYLATDDIAIGDTIVPNTNCKATNVATELQNGNKAIVFDTKTATLASIASGAPQTVQVDCSKAGYTCEGCISFDSNNSRLLVSECTVSNNTLNYRIYNVSDSTIENVTMNFKLIYSAN